MSTSPVPISIRVDSKTRDKAKALLPAVEDRPEIALERVESGIYPDLPESVYRADPWSPLPSWSSVGKCATDSPLHARHAADGRTVETDAMRLGTAIHMAALEPERFAAEYVVPPKVDRRTKAGKAEWAEWVEAHPDAAHVTAEQHATATECGEHARAILDRLLPGWPMAMREASVCSDVYGVRGRARLDLCEPGEYVIDLKTTHTLTPRAIDRACWDRGYAGQLASYRAMLDCEASTTTPRLGILWVQTTAPRFAALTWLSDDYQRRADQMARKAWGLWVECESAGVWAPPAIPAYIDAPGWA